VATASNNVQVKVTYQGVDNASRASASATKGVEKFGQSADRAKKKVDSLRGGVSKLASGDILEGVKQLREGLGGSLAAKAAIGAAGVAALGAAAAVAVTKVAKLTVEFNRLSASADAAFGTTGGEGFARALSLAEQVGGVGAENIVKLASTLKLAGVNATVTTEQLQELTNRATTAGVSGDEALKALNDALRTGSTEALSAAGTFVSGELAVANYARAIGVSAETLDLQTRRQVVADAVLRDLNATTQRATTAYSQQDNALSALGNATLRLKLIISDELGPSTASLVSDFAQFTQAAGTATRAVIALGRLGFAFLGQQIGLIIGPITTATTALRALATGDLAGAADAVRRFGQVTRDNFRDVGNAAARLGRVFSEDLPASARAGAIQTVNAFDAVNRAVAQANQVAAKAAKDAQRQARIARARAAAARRRAEDAREQAAYDRYLAKLEQQRRAEIAETKKLEAYLARQAFEEEQRIQQRSAAATKRIEEEQRRTAIAAFDDAIARFAAVQGQIGQLNSTLANSFATLPGIAGAALESLKGKLDNYIKATEIASQALTGFVDAEKARYAERLTVEEQAALAAAKTEEERTAIQAKYEAKRAKNVEDTERRKAAILALTSAAQAALFIALGQPFRAAAAGVAAAGFAAVAGGLVKRTGGASAGAGASTGGGAATSTATADAAPSTQGNVVVNFQGGFVIGTQQQLGQAIAGSLKSLQTTGLATAGGV
jgi:hypothetical protein